MYSSGGGTDDDDFNLPDTQDVESHVEIDGGAEVEEESETLPQRFSERRRIPGSAVTYKEAFASITRRYMEDNQVG